MPRGIPLAKRSSRQRYGGRFAVQAPGEEQEKVKRRKGQKDKRKARKDKREAGRPEKRCQYPQLQGSHPYQTCTRSQALALALVPSRRISYRSSCFGIFAAVLALACNRTSFVTQDLGARDRFVFTGLVFLLLILLLLVVFLFWVSFVLEALSTG